MVGMEMRRVVGPPKVGARHVIRHDLLSAFQTFSCHPTTRARSNPSGLRQLINIALDRHRMAQRDRSFCGGILGRKEFFVP